MGPLRRWLLRRRHGQGRWGTLLEPYRGEDLVSLDLETTGLNPRRDHILSIAAVPLRGGRLRLSERFERSVRPDREFGIDSIRHHRIIPSEAAAGISVTTAVHDLLGWLGNRPLLGFHLGFDIAMLDPHVRRIAGFGLPNSRHDLGLAYARLQQLAQPDGEIDLGFETIATQLGVPVLGRHTALGDAVTVGLCWLALHATRPRRGAPVGPAG